MSGETDLAKLMQSMEPRLHETPFVFCSVASFEGLQPLATLREDEGLSVIVEQAQADAAGLAYEGRWAWITLTVHSSLHAVGFIAAISARLAVAGISVNPVSAYSHDHLFVPWERREEAMGALRR